MFLGNFYSFTALIFFKLMLIYLKLITYFKKVTYLIENLYFDSFSLESTLLKAFMIYKTYS